MYRIGSVENLEQTKNIIFIHIPKTGGSSVDLALRKSQNFVKNTLPNNKFSPFNIIRKIKGLEKPDQHSTALLIKNVIGEKRWNNSFSFAFVRNPWDLMVSSYQYLKDFPRVPKTKLSAEICLRVKAMKDFTEYIKSDLGQSRITFELGNLSNWVCDKNQKIIVNFVGKLENIEDDWNYICQETGLISVPLPHQNKSNRRKYQDYYNEETKDIIAKRFEWSINQFNYTF